MAENNSDNLKILVIAQVEDDANVIRQIEKQTLQPDYAYVYVDEKPASGIDERRKRIAKNHEVYLRQAVESIDCDYVWQIEGDGIMDEFTLSDLVDSYFEVESDNIGYMSGAEVGRHGVQCIGGWHFNKDRTRFASVDFRNEGIVPIDASGFYCLFMRKEVWLEGVCYWSGERWGCDVNWGLSLRDKGYKHYMDTRIQIGHATNRGILNVKDRNTSNVEFWLKDGDWKYKIDF